MFQERRREKKKKGNKIIMIKKKEKTGEVLLVCRKLAGNGEKASFVEEGVWRSGASLPRAAAFITEHIFGARVNISYHVSSKHIKAGVP